VYEFQRKIQIVNADKIVGSVNYKGTTWLNKKIKIILTNIVDVVRGMMLYHLIILR